jgi:hypothetical protein
VQNDNTAVIVNDIIVDAEVADPQSESADRRLDQFLDSASTFVLWLVPQVKLNCVSNGV